jgi:hypothetical protein
MGGGKEDVLIPSRRSIEVSRAAVDVDVVAAAAAERAAELLRGLPCRQWSGEGSGGGVGGGAAAQSLEKRLHF